MVVAAAMWMVACSSSRYVPDGQYLLQGVEMESDDDDFETGPLQQYIRQKGNSKWFSLFKIPLGVYALGGRDTTKWINRTLHRIGEKPVLYDSAQARLTTTDLVTAMQNMGYMDARVEHKTKTKDKKLKAIYTLHPGKPFLIRHMRYDIQDDTINSILTSNDSVLLRLHDGSPFTINELDGERSRITSLLMDRGYWKFHKEFIRFEADTMRGSRLVDVTMHLRRFRANNDAPETQHPRYRIRDVNFVAADTTGSHIRRSVLENNSLVEEGYPYNASAVQETYNNFSRLQAVKYANLRFTEVPDSNLLDCNIQYGVNKPSTILFQPEGTNTAGDLGAAASVTYQNRNLFHGSEQLSVQLRGAFEAITKLEGYQSQNYVEYGVESKITFPRFVAPFLSTDFKRNFRATSEVSLSYNLQNRPEFHRRVVSAGWKYRWGKPGDRWTYRFDAFDLNYIRMPWISSTFKSEYLDSVDNRNAILKYNYENLFILRTGFGITYNNRIDAVKANVELGGNLLRTVASALNFKQNENGQYTLFNVAFAQYVKCDFDYTRVFNFDQNNALVMHAGLGVAYPYGNSIMLPFEKRYFSGGANSVRGWRVRGLGPGSFRGHNGAIDFINQTGDMKIDLNLEYRSRLFWKLYGALFLDGGNIWTLRDYKDQPGGQFSFRRFYKELAVAYGLGLRLNFDYFVLRFDMGMKAVDPAYPDGKEHYPIAHPDLSRDFAFHFAVGLPF
jgi:outer membrane protein assembly factor BamA